MKAVVLMSFWQMIFIALLVHYDVINGKRRSRTWTDETGAKQLQDFCIIIEMFIGAIAHHYYLSWRDFQEVYDDGYGVFAIEDDLPEAPSSPANEGGDESNVEVGGGSSSIGGSSRSIVSASSSIARAEKGRKKDEQGGSLDGRVTGPGRVAAGNDDVVGVWGAGKGRVDADIDAMSTPLAEVV